MCGVFSHLSTTTLTYTVSKWLVPASEKQSKASNVSSIKSQLLNEERIRPVTKKTEEDWLADCHQTIIKIEVVAYNLHRYFLK